MYIYVKKTNEKKTQVGSVVPNFRLIYTVELGYIYATHLYGIDFWVPVEPSLFH